MSVLDGAICSSGIRSELVVGVVDQAVVAEFGEFLDPDSGVSQRLDRYPGPERAVFFSGQVTAGAGDRVLGQSWRWALSAPGRGERPRPGR